MLLPLSMCPCNLLDQDFKILTKSWFQLAWKTAYFDRSSLFLSLFPVLLPLSQHFLCTLMFLNPNHHFPPDNLSLGNSLILHLFGLNQALCWFIVFQSIENYYSDRKCWFYYDFCELFSTFWKGFDFNKWQHNLSGLNCYFWNAFFCRITFWMFFSCQALR